MPGEVGPDLVDALLSLPSGEEQEAYLRDADLLNADGLKSLAQLIHGQASK